MYCGAGAMSWPLVLWCRSQRVYSCTVVQESWAGRLFCGAGAMRSTLVILVQESWGLLLYCSAGDMWTWCTLICSAEALPMRYYCIVVWELWCLLLYCAAGPKTMRLTHVWYRSHAVYSCILMQKSWGLIMCAAGVMRCTLVLWCWSHEATHVWFRSHAVY